MIKSSLSSSNRDSSSVRLNSDENRRNNSGTEVLNRILPPPQLPNRHPINFEDMKSERARLQTFNQPPIWPHSFILPEDCAAAGFFFLHDGDKVQCAFCRGVAGEWVVGDVPLSEHHRHFPRCPFICNLPVGNAPIRGGVDGDVNLRRGFDVCGTRFNPTQRFTTSDQVILRGTQPLGQSVEEAASELAITRCRGPMHLNFVTLFARLKTFAGWVGCSAHGKDQMAEAGFFYLGVRDHVKCFYCDGGLRNWEINDDPWVEHARWFPNCSFVKLNKGETFIKDVKANKPPLVAKAAHKRNHLPVLRVVSEEEIRNLIDTPIVKAALDMGMEVNKVKEALRKKLQETGSSFLTTEALLEAMLGRDSEYDSDSDSSESEGEDDTGMVRIPRMFIPPPPSIDSGVISEDAFSSPSHSSPDEDSGGDSSGDSDEGLQELPRRNMIETDEVGESRTLRTISGDSGFDQNEQPSVDDKMSDEEKPSTSNIVQNPNVSEDLEAEILKLREARQCKICMDNEVNVVFLPCGHLVSCVSCATALSTCALCRQPIRALVRTYLA